MGPRVPAMITNGLRPTVGISRWGASLDMLPPDHFSHDLEASYIAQLCVNLIYSFAPEVIILGGGVMQVPGLIEKVRTNTLERLGGYWTPASAHGDDLCDYIVLPALEYPGLWGALALALAAERASSGGEK